jgi:hypothetical protein
MTRINLLSAPAIQTATAWANSNVEEVTLDLTRDPVQQTGTKRICRHASQTGANLFQKLAAWRWRQTCSKCAQ